MENNREAVDARKNVCDHDFQRMTGFFGGLVCVKCWVVPCDEGKHDFEEIPSGWNFVTESVVCKVCGLQP